MAWHAKRTDGLVKRGARHTHGPNFGRRVVGCARCDELAAGAAPRVGWSQWRAVKEAAQMADLRTHFASAKHLTGGCGPVCTYGDW
jgi:hypothetical protein